MSKQTQLTALFSKNKSKNPPIVPDNESKNLAFPNKKNKTDPIMHSQEKVSINLSESQLDVEKFRNSFLDPNPELGVASQIIEAGSAQNTSETILDQESILDKEQLDKQSQAEKRNFQEAWLKEYEGLIYDKDKDLMYCAICQKHSLSMNGQNIFVKGTNKKTTDVLYYHWRKHKGHQEAVKASKVGKTSKKIFENLVVKNETKNLMLMKISYFICKNQLSFNKFNEISCLIFQQIIPMISDQERLDNKQLNFGSHYENADMCVQFVDSIGFVVERSIIEQIYKSEYYSILVDESMDITKKEQLLIYAKYYDNSKQEFKTSFLTIINVKEQNGAQLFLSIKNFLEKKRLHTHRCISFGSDGAYNMTGYRKGVYSYLLKLNPFLILRHCANHRLALANSDTVKEVNFIKEYIDIVQDIYSFFSKSARRNVLLKKFQAEVIEPELQVLKMCPTRWLSLSRCVKNISKMFQSLILTFDEELNMNDNGLTPDSKEKYSKVLLHLCEYKFIGLTYFLLDILGVVDNLCYELQSDSLNYGNYVISVNNCMNEIQENYVNKEIYGANFRNFQEKVESKEFLPNVLIDKSDYQKSQTKIIISEFSNCLYKNLKNRFDVDDTVMLFRILIIENIRKNENEVAFYGISELDKLIEIFGARKKSGTVEHEALIDPTETRSEWRLFKRLIKNNYLQENNTTFWSKNLDSPSLKTQYPNIRRLGYIANVLPMSTAICERGFSTLNLIKDELRNKLGEKNLEQAMRIAIEGCDIQEFDFLAAYSHWNSSSSRRFI